MKAMDMAKATWDKLNEFGRGKGLCCKTEEPDWAGIAGFTNIGYDLSTDEGRKADFRHEISDQDLRIKIQLLGLPWRSLNGRSRP